MGNKIDSRNKNIKDIFHLENYNQKDKKYDEVYGEMLLLQDRSVSEQRVMKQKMVNDENVVQQMSGWLDKMYSRGCPNIITLLQYHTLPDESLCASTYVVYTCWQYLENNLSSEVQLRSCSGQGFVEHQILKLIKHVVNAMAFLQTNNKAHKHLNSTSILVDSEGTYKLIDPSFFQVIPNLAKVIDMSASRTGEAKDNLYISPEQMAAVKEKDFDPQLDHFKSDVFIFAVIILETIELESQSNLFNYQHYKINYNEMQLKKNKIKQNNFPYVTEFLDECLTIEADQRPNWLTLKKKYGELVIQKSEALEKSVNQNSVNSLIKSTLQQNQAHNKYEGYNKSQMNSSNINYN